MVSHMTAFDQLPIDKGDRHLIWKSFRVISTEGLSVHGLLSIRSSVGPTAGYNVQK